VFHVVCLLLTEQALLPLLLRHLPAGTRSLLIAESVLAGVGLLFTMLCAMLSYLLLEQPFLKLKRRFTVVSSRPT
jgi:peptidoglycan/LPS O-acetylase OafA/YrhL